MKIICKKKQMLETVSGETERGRWYRGGMLCESIDGQSKAIPFIIMGIQNIEIAEEIPYDATVEVDFVIDARTFNNKWYVDLRVINMTHLVAK